MYGKEGAKEVLKDDSKSSNLLKLKFIAKSVKVDENYNAIRIILPPNPDYPDAESKDFFD
jgi:hypothetical protein